MRGMKSIGQNKCAFCRKYILDPGSLLLSKVNLENLTNWCEIMMDMDSEDVDELIRAARVCRYCIWDAKYESFFLIYRYSFKSTIVIFLKVLL